jgi:hypothetical protein
VILDLGELLEVRWPRRPWQCQGHVSTIHLTPDVVAYALQTQPVRRPGAVAVEHLRAGDPMLDSIDALSTNDLTIAFYRAQGHPHRWFC